MAAKASRAVPHINHTSELEAAAIAVANAKDSKGRAVMLCTNPLDLMRVRASLSQIGSWFEDPAFYSEGEETPGEAELAAAENLILLATLLREHIRAGNLHDRKD